MLAIRGLEVSKTVGHVKLPDYASYKVARELYRQHSKTDSLLIQERRSVAYTQELEDDTQKPALSSTTASLRWVMHVLGIKVPIPGFGKLLGLSSALH